MVPQSGPPCDSWKLRPLSPSPQNCTLFSLSLKSLKGTTNLLFWFVPYFPSSPVPVIMGISLHLSNKLWNLCVSVLFLQPWFMVPAGLLGRGVVMYGFSGYSYLLSYGKAAAESSQALTNVPPPSFRATWRSQLFDCQAVETSITFGSTVNIFSFS